MKSLERQIIEAFFTQMWKQSPVGIRVENWLEETGRAVSPSFLAHSGLLRVLQRSGLSWQVLRRGESKLGLLKWQLKTPDLGQAPVRLVLMPGFGDTLLSWIRFFVFLRPALLRMGVHEIVYMDFPGYCGFLQMESAIHSMDLKQGFVGDLLEGLQPKILIGHSLGGWLSAAAAFEKDGVSPEQLILVSPSGILPRSPLIGKHWKEKFTSAKQPNSPSFLPNLFDKMPLGARLVEKELDRFFEQEEIYEFVDSVEPTHFLEESLAKYPGQVQLIWGERDRLNSTHWQWEWLRHGGAGLSAYQMRGVGHNPMVEKPRVLSRLITEILEGRPPTTWTRGREYWRISDQGFD